MEKYGDATQLICNLQYKKDSYIPTLAHSALGYNNHSVIPKFSGECKECDVTCIGENTEKFIFFSLRKKNEIVKI